MASMKSAKAALYILGIIELSGLNATRSRTMRARHERSWFDDYGAICSMPVRLHDMGFIVSASTRFLARDASSGCLRSCLTVRRAARPNRCLMPKPDQDYDMVLTTNDPND